MFSMGARRGAKFSKVPLLCKEGRRGGRNVERELSFSHCNLSPLARFYPTLILPLQRGGDLTDGILEKPKGTNPTENLEVLNTSNSQYRIS